MPCLLALLILVSPRLVLVLVWLFTNWTRVFQTTLWPFLGFLFLPYTTLAYMLAMLNSGGHISGFWLALVIVGFILDCGGQGSTVKGRRRRR